MADSRSELPHEKLEVYRVALEFHAACLKAVPRRGLYSLRLQLERAGMSVVLNIAEGAGRNAWPDKRRFYEVAKGSATECAAVLDILDILSQMRAGDPQQIQGARALAIRVVQMLSRMSGPVR